MEHKTSRYFGFLFLFILLALPLYEPAEAQQGGAVTGHNLTSVTFSQGARVEKQASGDWIEYGADGQERFYFVETGRDATSVYLNDLSRNFAIRLDVSDRTLSFQNDQGQKAVFGRMSAMSAAPVFTPAPQPPQTPYQPQAPSANPPWLQQQGQTVTQVQPPVQAPYQPQPPIQQQTPSATPPWLQQQGHTVTQVQPPVQAPYQPQPPVQQQTPSATPPWLRNRNGNEQNGGQTTPPVAVPQAADLADTYSGVWVERDVNPRKTGDGVSTPITWRMPKSVSIERIDANRMVVRYHEQPVAFAEVWKVSDTQFSGSGTTLTFKPFRDSYFLTIRDGNGTHEYAQSKTAEGRLSKTRFETAPQIERGDRYSLESNIKEWNTVFHGFDGTQMDLFDFTQGRRAMLFRQPGNFESALDDQINLALPFGLRGERLRSSDMSQREALITRATEYQKSYSANFGGGSVFASTSTKAEIGKGGGVSTQNMQAVGLANIERYVLYLDKPNAELSDSFREMVDRMVNQGLDPNAIINKFGTHYANALVFGGIAKATKTMTAKEVMKSKSASVHVEVSGQFKGITASAGGGTSQSSSNKSGSMFSNDEFNAIGGTGTTSLSSWTVSDNDTVPERYDLMI